MTSPSSHSYMRFGPTVSSWVRPRGPRSQRSPTPRPDAHGTLLPSCAAPSTVQEHLPSPLLLFLLFSVFPVST